METVSIVVYYQEALPNAVEIYLELSDGTLIPRKEIGFNSDIPLSILLRTLITLRHFITEAAEDQNMTLEDGFIIREGTPPPEKVSESPFHELAKALRQANEG